MDIPTNAIDAARVLVDLAHVRGNPTASYDGDIESTASAWDAVTFRRLPDGVAARVLHEREVAAFRACVDLALPEVVATLPSPYLPRGWSLMLGDPSPRALAEDGWPRSTYGPLVERPAKSPNKRPRIAFVRPDEVPPGSGPKGAHALAVAALGARVVADRLDAWASATMPSEQRRASAESAAYRAFADDAEARIPEAFAWVEGLPEPALVVAFPTVPAVVRGVARPGVT